MKHVEPDSSTNPPSAVLFFRETGKLSPLIMPVWVCVMPCGLWLEDFTMSLYMTMFYLEKTFTQHPQRLGMFPKINQTPCERNTDMLYSATEAQPKQNTLVSLWRKNKRHGAWDRKQILLYLLPLCINWARSPCWFWMHSRKVLTQETRHIPWCRNGDTVYRQRI